MHTLIYAHTCVCIYFKAGVQERSSEKSMKGRIKILDAPRLQNVPYTVILDYPLIFIGRLGTLPRPPQST